MGSGTDLIGFQVGMVTTHCVVTLRALHDGHVVLGDPHGVLGDEFRDPGLVLTGEDQQAREPTARTGIGRVDLHGCRDLLWRGSGLVGEGTFTRTASW